MGVTMEHEQVQEQEPGDDDAQQDPEGEVGLHAGSFGMATDAPKVSPDPAAIATGRWPRDPAMRRSGLTRTTW